MEVFSIGWQDFVCCFLTQLKITPTIQDAFVGTDLMFSSLSMLVLKTGSQNHKIQGDRGKD